MIDNVSNSVLQNPLPDRFVPNPTACVVKNNTRTLPLQKLDMPILEENQDIINDTYQTIIMEAAEQIAIKQAAEKEPLQYLKNVEGRVLTVLEAAISNDSQREAVKSLIKKEFRREMNRVNRSSNEE